MLTIQFPQILAMYDNIVMAKERGSLDSHRKASMMEKIGFYRSAKKLANNLLKL